MRQFLYCVAQADVRRQRLVRVLPVALSSVLIYADGFAVHHRRTRPREHPGTRLYAPAVFAAEQVNGERIENMGRRCYDGSRAYRVGNLLSESVRAAQMPGEQAHGEASGVVHAHNGSVSMLVCDARREQSDCRTNRHHEDKAVALGE